MKIFNNWNEVTDDINTCINDNKLNRIISGLININTRYKNGNEVYYDEKALKLWEKLYKNPTLTIDEENHELDLNFLSSIITDNDEEQKSLDFAYKLHLDINTYNYLISSVENLQINFCINDVNYILNEDNTVEIIILSILNEYDEENQSINVYLYIVTYFYIDLNNSILLSEKKYIYEVV